LPIRIYSLLQDGFKGTRWVQRNQSYKEELKESRNKNNTHKHKHRKKGRRKVTLRKLLETIA
jgi:hypothetical protein